MKHWFFYKKRHYILVVILLIFFLSLPSLSIFFYSFSSAEKLQNLPIAILLEYLKQTFFLSLGVCFFSALLGITQALLVVFFDFKGKKFLEWALILPFLFPPYILAYLYTDFFEYAGIFKIATLATLVTLCISFLLAYFRRKIENKKIDALANVTILSYALPGTVLSIGFILLTRQLDQWC